MTNLLFDNYSRFSRDKHGTKIYSWCVFIKGSQELIQSIEMVEYTLHPTFPNPIREVTDRDHCFALQSEGWGTFEIDIRVFFKNSQEEYYVHMLKLESDEWPKGPKLERFESSNFKLVYEALFDPKWEWRKVSTIARASSLSNSDTIGILKKLASGDFVRKAYFRSIDTEELWGATCKIGILPALASR